MRQQTHPAQSPSARPVSWSSEGGYEAGSARSGGAAVRGGAGGGALGDGLVVLGPLAPRLDALAGLAGGTGFFVGDLGEEVVALAAGAVHGARLLPNRGRFSTLALFS